MMATILPMMIVKLFEFGDFTVIGTEFSFQ
jgi:hypothetical protein